MCVHVLICVCLHVCLKFTCKLKTEQIKACECLRLRSEEADFIVVTSCEQEDRREVVGSSSWLSGLVRFMMKPAAPLRLKVVPLQKPLVVLWDCGIEAGINRMKMLQLIRSQLSSTVFTEINFSDGTF